MELVRGEDRAILRPGEPAPVFDLPDADLNIVSLEQFKRHYTVVLYFYPRDYAPNCIIEAIEFSEREHEFSRLHTVVLGVSRDDCMTHGRFRDEHGICVQLLADPDGEVCRRYGVLQEKEVEGRRKTGIVRSTFIIDREGMLIHAMYGVTARGHAADVFKLIKGLSKCR